MSRLPPCATLPSRPTEACTPCRRDRIRGCSGTCQRSRPLQHRMATMPRRGGCGTRFGTSGSAPARARGASSRTRAMPAATVTTGPPRRRSTGRQNPTHLRRRPTALPNRPGTRTPLPGRNRGVARTRRLDLGRCRSHARGPQASPLQALFRASLGLGLRGLGVELGL